MIDESKYINLRKRLEQQNDDILREFSYRCYAKALSEIENPTPLQIEGVELKRLYARGEAGHFEYCRFWIVRERAIDDAMSALFDYSEPAYLRNDPNFYSIFDILNEILSEIIKEKEEK